MSDCSSPAVAPISRWLGIVTENLLAVRSLRRPAHVACPGLALAAFLRNVIIVHVAWCSNRIRIAMSKAYRHRFGPFVASDTLQTSEKISDRLLQGPLSDPELGLPARGNITMLRAGCVAGVIFAISWRRMLERFRIHSEAPGDMASHSSFPAPRRSSCIGSRV